MQCDSTTLDNNRCFHWYSNGWSPSKARIARQSAVLPWENSSVAN